MEKLVTYTIKIKSKKKYIKERADKNERRAVHVEKCHRNLSQLSEK